MTQTSQALKNQLTKAWYAKAAQTFKTDERSAKALVDQALPTVWESLAKKSENPQGAEALTKALADERHDGRILDPNQDFFTDHNLDEGDKILRHVLGDTRDDIAEALAAETHTKTSQAKKALAAVSPLIMGALGKAVQSEKLNVEQVTTILKLAVKERDFGRASHRIAVLIWDKNKDGQFKDDWFNAGKRWLSSWLTRKK